MEANEEDADDGVKRIEAISSTWTKWGLIVAYISLIAVANTTSLEVQITSNLTAFATSTFSAHSLLSTVTVIQGCVNAVIKPTLAKTADVFGRFESFCFAIIVYTIGYIQQASSRNVQTYASAQIFYAAGSQGLQMLQQIFVADTTDLRYRSVISSVLNLPFLWTVWVGAPIAQKIMKHLSWRWGYGIFSVILPLVFLPLAVVLLRNQIIASRQGKLRPRAVAGLSPLLAIKTLWLQLDVFGLVLLSAAICLILIPLTLAKKAQGEWSNPSIISMLAVGGLCLVLFPLWERSSRFAPNAFFPKSIFQNRTVIAGVILAFFYFMAFYLSVFPYFFSYLMVVHNKSVTSAGRITQIFSFASTITAFLISWLIKYTCHYKYFVTLGCCVYILGLGLLIKYRQQGTSTAVLVACQIAVGIGGGMLNVPVQLGIQASVSHQNVAGATAAFLTLLEVGGAVGAAISGAIWTHSIPKRLQLYLPDKIKDQAEAIFGNITLASTGWEPGTPERNAINKSYQETMSIMLTIALSVSAPLIPLSLMMKNYKLDQIDQGRGDGIIISSNQKSGNQSDDEEATEALTHETSG